MSTLDDIAKAANATSFALDLLEKIVAFVGASAAKDHIDQFEAARLAADAADAAKFGP
jgi:hypothetical protein